MTKQKEDNSTIDIFHNNDDLTDFLNKKIDESSFLKQISHFDNKEEFIGEYSSESRYVIADFNDDNSINKIKTIDLEVFKSFDLNLKNLKIIFPNETILFQKLSEDEFEFSINDNIDFLEKIEKQRNKSNIKKSENIDPDKLLKSIEAMEGIDPEEELEENLNIKKKATKRKL